MEHLTLFSDDTFCYWRIRSLDDLTRAAKQLLHVIQTLEALEMGINFSKSGIACQLRGNKVAVAHKKFFSSVDGSYLFRLRREHKDILIPVLDHLEYLGVILSYGSFELQTTRHRIQKAYVNYKALHKVLRTSGSLAAGHGLRIYKACILTSLQHLCTAP